MTASSGYFTMPRHDQIPIFTKQKINLKTEKKEIISVRVCNQWLVCLMSNNEVIRIFVPNASKGFDLNLDKFMGGCTVGRTFMDPSGFHYFITLVPKAQGLPHELLYICFDGEPKNIKPKKIDKFKDHEITAMGFNYNLGGKTSTGPILLGTSKGLIFECEFTPDCAMVPYRKMIFDLSKEKSGPITSINFFKIPNSTTFIALVATPNKLYKFYETVSPSDKTYLQSIFSLYKSGELFDNFEESEKPLKSSSFEFIFEEAEYPESLCWLNGSGIFKAQLARTTEFIDYLTEKEFIPLPNSQELENTASPMRRTYIPQSFALTKFHALLVYPEKITGICLLDPSKIIYEEQISLENYGKLLDIVKDEKYGSVYFYSTKAIFRFRVHDEQRDVWHMYLAKDEYDLAERYACNNLEYLDIIRGKRAESLFDQKCYLESAAIYSKTMLTFEEICLKFLALDDKKPLMTYLQARMERLNDEDSTQITMLVIWLIELFQIELSKAKGEEQRIWQQNFDYFLQVPRVAKCIRTNRSVVYDVMGAHGDSHNMAKLAAIYHDYEKVINENMNQKKFKESLVILKKQNNPELFYKYCPILMEAIPEETVSTLISLGNRLSPDKLIPTLICLDSKIHRSEVMRYLEFVIYSLSSEKASLHNFLLKLYAENSEDKLMSYLEAQGRDVSMIHYDIKYALRVCQEHEKSKACVFLQCLLEMWESAVELSLKFSIRLAKETANQPNDLETRRKLWLKIAQNEIKGTNDVKRALDLLKECDLLKIEDLLPYFSDFEKIDDFKEAICDALEKYNDEIKDLQKDMDECTKNADRIREDLKVLKDRSIRVSAKDKCSICDEILLLKSFIVFPCGHKFHTECVEKQIITTLSSEENRKLTSLKQQLENTVSQQQTIQQKPSVIAAREKIKFELETILASNCLFCFGMIESLDSSFITEKDWDKAKIDWE